MSVTVQETTRGADVFPPYFGQTRGGEHTTGQDIDRVLKAHCHAIGRAASEEEYKHPQALESSDALARFSKLESALRHLLTAPKSDEFGPVRPPPASIKRAIAMLFPLVQIGLVLPEPLDVGTDHDGAIRVVWENGPRLLELVVPYDDRSTSYLYYSAADRYDLQLDLTAASLRRRFNWLRGA